MRRNLLGGVLAGIVALAGTVAAQSAPAQQPPPTAPGASTSQPQSRMQDQARMVTVEGCLMREADVAGRKPNMAERAGMGDDYILTATKMVKGTAPRPGASRAAGETPTGTSGTSAPMYEVDGIDDDQLKQHVGRRVQIDGTFSDLDNAGVAPKPGDPTDDLVELDGKTIRQVAGDCPAK